MKSIICILPVLSLVLTAEVTAQSITPDVVASSGGHFTIGSTQLSWTLGELMTETLTGSTNIITQGFHQTDLLVTEVEDAMPAMATMAVYPNPTADRVTLSVEGEHGPLMAELYDAGGKLLLRQRIAEGQGTSEFDLDGLPSAQYLLRVADEADGSGRTFRIVRTAQ